MPALQRGEAVEITTETQLSVLRYVGTGSDFPLMRMSRWNGGSPDGKECLLNAGMDII